MHVHRAETKYSTLQLAAPIGQLQELFYFYNVQKQMFTLVLVDYEELSVFHAVYKKVQKWILVF